MEPNHRALRVEADLKAGKEPDDAYTESMRAYHMFLKEGAPDDSGRNEDHWFKCIFSSDFDKSLIEAALLGGCTVREAADLLDAPEKMIRWYEELFLDMSAFRLELEKLDYILNVAGEKYLLTEKAMLEGAEQPRRFNAYVYGCGLALGDITHYGRFHAGCTTSGSTVKAACAGRKS